MGAAVREGFPDEEGVAGGGEGTGGARNSKALSRAQCPLEPYVWFFAP